MVVTLLMLLCIFVLTWFGSVPEPFKIVLFVVEAVILILIVLPWTGMRAVP